ncbi:MAG: aldehyde dehydrogenase family protein [Vicinamibacteria bacterium]|nr:aldehyde dehydrogenase family protein [Vicinamibacteria bacterium]
MDTKALLSRLGIEPINSGGKGLNWVARPSGEEIISTNPANGEVLARVQGVSDVEYDRVVDEAAETFQRWRAVPAPKRGEIVRQIGDALRIHKEDLGALVTLEMGKILAEGKGEVQEMIDIADFATGLSRQLYGLSMHSERPGHRMYEQWHPLGPIGVISAFNFPVAVWSWNALVAAACGDTVVWKPSELAPLTAIATQKIADRILDRHGFSGVFTLAVGGASLGARLSTDPRLPLVSFTGSTAVGRKVGENTAKRLGRSLLELGGNNGIIVMKDADLDLALRGVVFGAAGTAGQRCTSTRRLFLQKEIAAAFTASLVKAYGQIKVGDPMDPQTLMGPLINERAVSGFKRGVENAVAEGGEVLFGGRVIKDRFVEPTIIKARADMKIVCEETFAPILYVIEFDEFGTAMKAHNDVPQGLSSAIFTTNLLTAETFLSATGSDCGIANVNIGTSGAEIGGAFGGEKDTGGGRESGSDAWKAYMRRQTNTINYSKDLPLAQGIVFGS